MLGFGFHNCQNKFVYVRNKNLLKMESYKNWLDDLKKKHKVKSKKELQGCQF